MTAFVLRWLITTIAVVVAAHLHMGISYQGWGALLGASLLLLADAVARTIVAPAELPIGIVTAVAGAPFFLWILLRKRGIVDL